MNQTQDQPSGEREHNPDNLTPEQYGAPEWRLLRSDEIPQIGDEWNSVIQEAWQEQRECDMDGRTAAEWSFSHRRRVTPAVPAPEPNHAGCDNPITVTTHPSPISGKPGRKLVHCGCGFLLSDEPYSRPGQAPEPAAQAGDREAIDAVIAWARSGESTGGERTQWALNALADRVESYRQRLASALRERDDKQKTIEFACRDWADDDTRVKAIAAEFGIKECHGTGDAFKGVIEIAEEMAAKIKEAQAERDAAHTSLIAAKLERDAAVHELTSALARVIAERDAGQEQLREANAVNLYLEERVKVLSIGAQSERDQEKRGLKPLPDYADAPIPIEPRERWQWMAGGDGSIYWATETQYAPHEPFFSTQPPKWATHIIYFGK